MRHYEMMLILSDQLDDDGANALLERVQGAISDGDGSVTQVDFWGKRPFAYEIAHRNHGYYAVLDFELEPTALAEIERQLKINDDVVRFKTVRPDVRTHKPGTVRKRIVL